ncbi:MAG TPA: alpha/beta hydrolase-fold protein [Kiritimatiellia bacterium]|nr:alpha/beta hydrolase-fold protein [Kiritimatiellia bacterium]
MYCFLLVSFAFLITVFPTLGRSPDREILGFSVATNVGFGFNVHVLGNHPDIGSWISTNAVKLRWTAGNIWTGQVAVQKGTELEYKYVARDGSPSAYTNISNIVWESGANRQRSVPAADDPPAPGKTVYYYSAWTSATLLVISETNFPAYPMTRIGPGRSEGEYLYRAQNVGEAGEWLEFVPNGWFNNTNYWDNPPYVDFNNNYFTPLDAFILQDGNIYNYWPSNVVSAPRVISNFVNSSQGEITGRLIRIYLPRGYDSHPERRYPVLYMQDGTNVFSPGGSFGSWDADLIATREISQGRMRETIIVAIDNMPNRRVEYNPPGSTYPTEPPGHADKYLKFLADNVRPTLDFNFRTLNERRNTFVGGSSMGGIFSVYAGYDTNLFGGIIAMSPAFTRATNYMAALWSREKTPIRIYMDTGSAEGQVGITPGGDYWESPWQGYDIFLSHGFAPNHDLMMRVGHGHGHNEAAWRARLPFAYRFILNVRDEPNRIAQKEWPPDVSAMPSPGMMTFNTLQHFNYQLDEKTGEQWNPTDVVYRETNAWSSAFSLTIPIHHTTVWHRVSCRPAE